ncbi:MAG TPA: hypothetical protein PKD12_24450 [Nitrospira sp.]|nr:hypothetical protein [Nitrospira sp.]
MRGISDTSIGLPNKSRLTPTFALNRLRRKNDNGQVSAPPLIARAIRTRRRTTPFEPRHGNFPFDAPPGRERKDLLPEAA